MTVILSERSNWLATFIMGFLKVRTSHFSWASMAKGFGAFKSNGTVNLSPPSKRLVQKPIIGFLEFMFILSTDEAVTVRTVLINQSV